MKEENFDKRLLKALKERLGEDAEVRLQQLRKNNDILMDAVTILEKGARLAPTIYLEDYEKRYRNGVPLVEIVENIVQLYRIANRQVSIPEDLFDSFESIRDRVYARVINKHLNSEALENLAYRSVMGDLCMVGCYELDPDCLENASVRIEKKHLEAWGISEEDFLCLAWENTVNQKETVFHSLCSLFTPEIKALYNLPEQEHEMFVLSTDPHNFGASVILFPDILEHVAERLDADLLLLPSSIHEWLILADHGDYRDEDLNCMIREINYTTLDPQEILSDHVYHYHRNV